MMFLGREIHQFHTDWLLPGSFTVTSCSSLYFSKAGVSSDTMSGEETVKALMSAANEISNYENMAASE
jgi:hypothetical protein